MSSSDWEKAPRPRLCHLKKWPDFSGYGFNLHAEKGKVGQYIGKVDEGSPSALTGLKENDRIVEVNGVNVGNENHQQVVERIKANPNETKLLVVDKETDAYYRDKKMVIRSDQPNVEIRECPDSKTGAAAISTVSGSPDVNAVEIPEENRPRVCVMYKWPDTGYGFQLQTGRNKEGNYISGVDKDSPAFYAGLREGDRIVEINDNYAYMDDHSLVVSQITQDPAKVKLMVVDRVANEILSKDVTVAELGGPIYKEAPVTKPTLGGVNTSPDGPASGSLSTSIPNSHGTVRPRLCVLRIIPDFAGYGFNLHAEKGKPGQFIGKVDAGSPAESGGLQEGDHIVEINNENISNLSHANVVEKIKSVPNVVKMLVVSGEDWKYAQDNDIHVHHDMPNVQVIDPLSAADSVVEKTEIAPVAAAAGIADDAPEPRNCHMKRWADFEGYGFNLHAEKGQTGHFIGTVDDDSPALFSGLKQGDKIVEVNGQNIWNESHQTVVQKIKSDPNAVTLLVIDADAEEYYNSRGITVSSSMSNTKNIYGPPAKPGSEIETKTESIAVSTEPVVAAAAVTGVATSSALDSDAPRPRLCHLKQWPDFQGYGFNLHVEKNRTGHFIGAVDENSPAYHSGLRKGDRIVEANGINVFDASHQDTITTIKSSGNSVQLLVLDPSAEEYYRNKGYKVNGSMDNIEKIVCPDNKPAPFITSTTAVTSNATTSLSLPSDAPHPRLCVLKKRPDFQGYGFNLMVIKDRPGNYIGNIESGSPAQKAGLLENDKIIEVNGHNILQEPHANVVNQIKSDPNQVSLLVLDPKSDEYYQNNNLVASSTQANVERLDSSLTEKSASPPASPPAAVVAAAAVPSTSPTVTATTEEYARICLLRRWADFQGYGFNLQAAKNKEGNYIGGVDPGSPAYYAGLKDGDRIVEVNGTPAYTDTHAAVVSLITQDPKQVKMLVVDRAAEQYFLSNNIEMNGQMANAKFIECPTTRPSDAMNGSVDMKPLPAVTTPVVSPTVETKPSPAVNNNLSGPGLSSGLSAAQLREQLRSKKKQDPRKLNMSLQEKKAIYDSL